MWSQYILVLPKLVFWDCQVEMEKYLIGSYEEVEWILALQCTSRFLVCPLLLWEVTQLGHVRLCNPSKVLTALFFGRWRIVWMLPTYSWLFLSLLMARGWYFCHYVHQVSDSSKICWSWIHRFAWFKCSVCSIVRVTRVIFVFIGAYYKVRLGTGLQVIN